MKEKIWYHIEKGKKEALEKFNDCNCYSTVDEKIGEADAYSFFAKTVECKEFLNILNDNGIKYNIFRREYSFTTKERNEAQILQLIVGDNAKDSYTSERRCSICDECGKRVQNSRIDHLYVDRKNIKKFDIATTYWTDAEIIVSEKLKTIFIRENVSGVEFLKIHDFNTKKEIEGFYHLRLSEGIGEVIEPSIVEKSEQCKKCGFYKKLLCQTPLNFEKRSWKQLDICFTRDWFGAPPMNGRTVVISQRLYKILKDNKIKNIYVKPAYLL